MKSVTAPLIGRWGNTLFIYAHLRAYAEAHGLEVHTQPWVGQKLFDINDPPCDGSEEVLPEHYHQDQDSMIYSRADAKRWFSWRPEIADRLSDMPKPRLAAHLRKGDYLDLGYPVVGLSAALSAIIAHGFGKETVCWVREEAPHLHDGFTGELSFVPDFWLLTRTEILFRSNSSFSFFAGLIGNGTVYSPVIDGLQGGIEHNSVPFIEGLWPKLAELPGITDLYIF